MPEAKGRAVFNALVGDMEEELNGFDPRSRAAVLDKLIALRIPGECQSGNVNLHMHTFFSYHHAAWSPSRFAWEARKAGLYAAGIIDFDGMDGVAEFLAAGEALGLRATAGVETRAFLSDFADQEIDSPGEPGVHYLAGSGMVKSPAAGTAEAGYLRGLRTLSLRRMREMADRINASFPAIAVDFDREVAARTPSGYATERHLAAAYVNASRRAMPMPSERADFWAGPLGLPHAGAVALMRDQAAWEDKIRSRLMKKGGIGYAQPGPRTFPPVGEVYAWIKACGGVAMDSWLDGTSAGEAKASELLECNHALGARALNLIPDRNWNVSDAAAKRRKLENLARVISLAIAKDMPLHIGTEGNRPGLPFADDLARPELAPYKAAFTQGARILIGHAVLARFADFPYAGDAAEGEFAGSMPAMNGFFEAVGALPPIDKPQGDHLRNLGPAAAFVALRDSARAGRWLGAFQPA